MSYHLKGKQADERNIWTDHFPISLGGVYLPSNYHTRGGVYMGGIKNDVFYGAIVVARSNSLPY